MSLKLGLLLCTPDGLISIMIGVGEAERPTRTLCRRGGAKLKLFSGTTVILMLGRF